MFCPQCRVEFVGWWKKCPDCSVFLVDHVPPEIQSTEKTMTYENLVELVNKNNGRMSIDVTSTGVERQHQRRFPFLGYGYAWSKRFQGSSNGIWVDLKTIETSRQKKWTFPYFGFGFAWEKKIQGTIMGIELTLTARKVSRKRRWDFPWLGYGYAWTEEMTGECGAELVAKLTVKRIIKKRSWGFPFFGFGYAWPRNAYLEIINIVDNPSNLDR